MQVAHVHIQHTACTASSCSEQLPLGPPSTLTACVTIALIISLCTDANTKYTGCHLEITAVAKVQDSARDFKTYAALAATHSAAATTHAMMTGRRLPPPGARHSKYSALLRNVSRHAKHVAATADAAKTTRNGRATDMGGRRSVWF
jgi:hypothetical protein